MHASSKNKNAQQQQAQESKEKQGQTVLISSRRTEEHPENK